MMMMAYPDAPGTPLSSSRSYAHPFAIPIAQPHAQQRERQQHPPFSYPASHNQPFSSSSMPSYSTPFMSPQLAPSALHATARPLSPVHINRAASLDRATSFDVFEPASPTGGPSAIGGAYAPNRSFSFDMFEEQVNRAHALSSLPVVDDRKLKPLVPFPGSAVNDSSRQWTFDTGVTGEAPQHPHYSPLPHVGHSQFTHAGYAESLAASQPFLPTGSMTLSTRPDRLRAGYVPHAQPILPAVTSPDPFGWTPDNLRVNVSASPVHSSVSDGKDAGSPRSVHSASPSHHSAHSDGRDDTAATVPPKKKRRRASGRQLEILNTVYARTAFPTTEERHELARQLDMSPRSVQIWFQNRRQSQRERRPMGASPLAPNVDRIPKRDLSAGRTHAAPYPTNVTNSYPMPDLFDLQVGAAADPVLDARSVAPLPFAEDTQLDNMRRGRPRRVRTP